MCYFKIKCIHIQNFAFLINQPFYHYKMIKFFFLKSTLISQTHQLFFFLIYFWLCWVFVSVRGLSPVVASGGHSSSRCAGLSLWRPLLLQSTGSRRAGSVVVAHGSRCSAACGIFPDQGSNPCPLHWQADSQPLHHQGSPTPAFYFMEYSFPSFYFQSSVSSNLKCVSCRQHITGFRFF